MKGISPKHDKHEIEKNINYTYFTCEPEIFEYLINPFKDEFIIVGSDGLFDKISS